MGITQIGDVRCILGEGPWWDVREQALYFVDVLGKTLWRYDERSDAFTHRDMPASISSIAFDGQGGAIVAMQSGLHHLSLDTHQLTPICNPARSDTRLLLNDGKADARGRFVIGTVVTTGSEAIAGLHSLRPDGVTVQLDTGFGITNGPCWSPDSSLFYLADSTRKIIYAYDYDLDSGAISGKRLFADLTRFDGIPDGATVDSAGRLWTALCDGANILCIDPAGKVVESIDFPTGFPTSLMFGGAKLDRLYVTSLDIGALSSVEAAAGAKHRADDRGGRLFVIDGLGATGVPEHHVSAAHAPVA